MRCHRVGMFDTGPLPWLTAQRLVQDPMLLPPRVTRPAWRRPFPVFALPIGFRACALAFQFTHLAKGGERFRRDFFLVLLPFAFHVRSNLDAQLFKYRREATPCIALDRTKRMRLDLSVATDNRQPFSIDSFSGFAGALMRLQT